VPDPAAPNAASHARGHFEGLLDEVKVYDRALSLQEAITEYNRQAAEKGLAPLDTSWFGQFRLTRYHYPQEEKLVVEVDYLGLLPIAEDSELLVDLTPAGGTEPVDRQQIRPNPDRPTEEVAFSLSRLTPGNYQVRALLKRRESEDVARTLTFATPPPRRALPDPNQTVVPALPPATPPVQYELDLAPGGGSRGKRIRFSRVTRSPTAAKTV
jgi:hypothetical protein